MKKPFIYLAGYIVGGMGVLVWQHSILAFTVISIVGGLLVAYANDFEV